MDRFSFLQFLGLQAGDDVPDARTIWDFKQLLEKNCQNFILIKGRRGHPLSEAERALNKLRSRIRVRGEHVFGRMAQMAMDRLRTIGLARASHVYTRPKHKTIA